MAERLPHPSAARTAFFALVCATGATLLEALAARPGSFPLDPAVDGRRFAQALVVATAPVLPVALLARGALPRRLALGLAAWALAWAPQLGRDLDLGWPVAAGLAVAVTLALLARRFVWLALVLGLLGPAARPFVRASPATLLPAARARGPDILLLTVDTVRADAGLVDHLSGAWRRYDQAISAAPWTLPAVTSLLSGEPVRVHGAGLPLQAGRYTRPVDGTPWLPEVLQQAGYRTVAVVCNPYLRPENGFDRGFHRFLHFDAAAEPLVGTWAFQLWRTRISGRVEALRHQRDALLEGRARAELARASADGPGGHLLWVHLLAPHEYTRDPVAAPHGWHPGTRDPALLQAIYATNVADAAARVNRLAQAARGWVVAVTADHGEAFGEGGQWGHGHALDDAELRVPLALTGPGIEAGIVSGSVPSADLARTLADLAGVTGLPGEDLRLAGPQAVEVGGLRRDAGAFARRDVDGHYAPRPTGAQGEGACLVGGPAAAAGGAGLRGTLAAVAAGGWVPPRHRGLARCYKRRVSPPNQTPKRGRLQPAPCIGCAGGPLRASDRLEGSPRWMAP